MKNKTWILLIGILLLACVGLSAVLLSGGRAGYAEIWSEGKLLYTLDLNVDTEITVQTEAGSNTITVKDGKIAVTAATCPDHYCMHRGFCSGGLQIVCLPNRLEIRFTDTQGVDGVVG